MYSPSCRRVHRGPCRHVLECLADALPFLGCQITLAGKLSLTAQAVTARFHKPSSKAALWYGIVQCCYACTCLPGQPADVTYLSDNQDLLVAGPGVITIADPRAMEPFAGARWLLAGMARRTMLSVLVFATAAACQIDNKKELSTARGLQHAA